MKNSIDMSTKDVQCGIGKKMNNVFKFNPSPDALKVDETFNGVPCICMSQIMDATIDETRNGLPLLRLLIKPIGTNLFFNFNMAVTENTLTHKYFKNFCESIGLDYPEDGRVYLNDIIKKTALVKYTWKKELITDNELPTKIICPKYFVKKNN